MKFSLRNFVENHSIIEWDKKLSILNDVCRGLHYLHTRNPPIVHRDLTPNNILLCSHLRAKITDLGVAITLRATDTKLTKAPGTADFMPPECVADDPVYGLPLDMFSFGGIILYLCVQQWPSLTSYVQFDCDGNKRYLTELERRQQHLDEMTGDYKDFKPLVISCLDDNPKNRPLVGEALMEIKQVKDAYNEKMYCTRIVQLQGQQQQPQPLVQQEIVQQQSLELLELKVSSDVYLCILTYFCFSITYVVTYYDQMLFARTSCHHKYMEFYIPCLFNFKLILYYCL